MIVDAFKLSVYFGDSLTCGRAAASDVLVQALASRGIEVAALYRGIEGFGLNRRIHAVRFPDTSTDLPLVVTAVDSRERIRSTLEQVDQVVARGLVTLENARLATGDDLAQATFPSGPGGAAKLTVFCGRGEKAAGRLAFREVVDVLRSHGASGATVLLGVDGVLHGERRRARLFGLNDDVPLMIISVGDADALTRSLPDLCARLPRPVATLERIALVKHDGELLEPLPTVADSGDCEPDLWQTIRIYTRATALVEGRTLHTEVTRRLREAGAAGVTTIRGEWGFSSDERPHGDKFGRLNSHAPTYTVYIDRPRVVASAWPIVDELTARHGIVTSLFVPGYRERAGDVVSGRL